MIPRASLLKRTVRIGAHDMDLRFNYALVWLADHDGLPFGRGLELWGVRLAECLRSPNAMDMREVTCPAIVLCILFVFEIMWFMC